MKPCVPTISPLEAAGMRAGIAAWSDTPRMHLSLKIPPPSPNLHADLLLPCLQNAQSGPCASSPHLGRAASTDTEITTSSKVTVISALRPTLMMLEGHVGSNFFYFRTVEVGPESWSFKRPFHRRS